MATNRDRRGAFYGAPSRPIPEFAKGSRMIGEMVALGVAAGAAWLVCFLLIERVQNRRVARRLFRDNSGPPGGIAGGDGWSPLGFSPPGWSGNDNSPSFDSSGNPGSSGGGDSGGGGGGDGGGGTGGGD